MTVIAALFICFVFVILAAFTVDFGMAYNTKRQLQTSADSGALAAAAVYKHKTLPCATLKSDTGLHASAQTAADKWAQMNLPTAQGSPVVVDCDGSALTVDYAAGDTSDATFGVLAGVSEIDLSRTAQARIGRLEVGNMRPWGICSSIANTTGQVVFVPMYNSSTSSQDSAGLCGTTTPPGGWWVGTCTGQANGTGPTETTVTSGCSTSTYKAVPGQSPTDTPVQRRAFLKAACPGTDGNDTCIKSDQGSNFHNTHDEWQPLVGQTFTMPVFCSTPACDSLAYNDLGGNNALYPIYRMAEVELCGFHFKNGPSSPSTGWPTEGPCATSNPKGYSSGDVLSGAGFFLVVKRLTGGAMADWELPEFRDMRLTK